MGIFGNKQLFGCLVLLGFWFLPMTGWAQDEKESVQQFRDVAEFKMPTVETREGVLIVPDPTDIEVEENTGLDSAGVHYTAQNNLWELMERHVVRNKERSETEGFRIQIYAGSSLESANDAKADYLESFYADQRFKVYQMWNPPHFRVRVGDFLTRNSAMREIAAIREVFPDAFIVSDRVKLPKYRKLTPLEVRDDTGEGGPSMNDGQ